MGKKLAIKGHLMRGKEVIELLEMMGGKSTIPVDAILKRSIYTISEGVILEIPHYNIEFYDFSIFTLEEFLEKYPFKVGDKVFLYDNIIEGCVTGIEWDEDKGTVKYCVYTSSECWCDVEELLKWNNVDLVEKHYMDNMEEKDKAKAPDIKGEDYSGKRFGYKIPDGYEFDVVVDGKIFLKPIKSKYPKTYVECCKILDIREEKNYTQGYKCGLISKFQELFIARNTYWKIAGEQMGLGKPWEPDLENEELYCIQNYNKQITISRTNTAFNKILIFPTEEMRDAFYENFKDLIEQCKELL